MNRNISQQWRTSIFQCTLFFTNFIILWSISTHLTMRDERGSTLCVCVCVCMCVCVYIYIYTGRFIMFSVIINIYNKKTKRTCLNGIVHSHRKTEKVFFFFFLTARDVRCVHYGWRGTHRYDIQVHATHDSTWVHRYSSLLQWSVPLGQRGHVAMVLSVICTNCTLHSNHRLTRVIFQHTKRLLPPSGHFLTTYTRIA